MNGLISVIIPVFNAEKYLEKCINSVLNQSYKNIEVILVNDGSTDNSENILQDYKSKYDNIVVFNQNNSGVSSARNNGLKIAKGDYITFIDSDDYIDSNTYLDIISAMIQSGADAAMYAMVRELSGKDDVEVFPWPDKSVLDNSEIKNQLVPYMIGVTVEETAISGSVARTVWRKTALGSLMFDTDIHIQEDLVYCLESYCRLDKLLIVNKPFYHYVKHEVTSTEKYRRDFFAESISTNGKIINILKDNGLFELCKNRYWGKRIMMYTLCISNLFRFNAPEDWKDEFKDIVSYFGKDIYVQNNVSYKYANKYRIITYFLLKFKMNSLVIGIYKLKEKRRREKLTN